MKHVHKDYERPFLLEPTKLSRLVDKMHAPIGRFVSTRSRLHALKVSAASALLLLSLSACMRACERHRTPIKYLVPDGYIGWIKVEFGVIGAGPLPREDSVRIAKVPADGVLRTSDPMEFGWASDLYFYYNDGITKRLEYTGWGGGGMVWPGYNSDTHLYKFIGPEKDFLVARMKGPE